MGKVAAVYNVVPESPEVPVEEVMENIAKNAPAGVEVATMNVKPFAFGLKIIEVTGIMDDTEGLIEKFEESLRSVPRVQGVDSVTITLI
ncbi:MAG TPA: elongation factor 1-beta [Methanomassiliicoccaceae archaeon]|jgi:elongation factor 1-beta|nr:elongation factor 1-beta [Euryarchaeota archaeon]HOB38309.1 elongation factor 1-beta [Methanomassiliicoccaceae archaeon]HOK27910.1 elongation factor 1-beta [Methanomassiliicoccaceae archaeon]HOL07328.1 elongation factor 1-beta [Methanomassiliicoccaceae archaeon]HOQ25443.1 elongation factor 1-beta [Methanomassiliicoccaceae archaeon]